MFKYLSWVTAMRHPDNVWDSFFGDRTQHNGFKRRRRHYDRLVISIYLVIESFLGNVMLHVQGTTYLLRSQLPQASWTGCAPLALPLAGLLTHGKSLFRKDLTLVFADGSLNFSMLLRFSSDLLTAYLIIQLRLFSTPSLVFASWIFARHSLTLK